MKLNISIHVFYFLCTLLARHTTRIANSLPAQQDFCTATHTWCHFAAIFVAIIIGKRVRVLNNSRGKKWKKMSYTKCSRSDIFERPQQPPPTLSNIILCFVAILRWMYIMCFICGHIKILILYPNEHARARARQKDSNRVHIANKKRTW